MWEALGNVFAGEENVVIAKVDATATGDLASKFGVSGYPTIKYFGLGAAAAEGEDYGNGRELKDFVEFLNLNAGTKRSPDGGLLPEAGRVEELDAIISEDAQVTTSTLQRVEKVVEGLTGEAVKHGNLYVKALKKILEKGDSYVNKEIARLEQMVKDANVKPEKKTLFWLRQNILKSFKKEKDEL